MSPFPLHIRSCIQSPQNILFLPASSVLMIGGKTNLMEVWSPHSESNLTRFDSLPYYAGGHGTRATVLGNQVYLCGGHKKLNESFKMLDECWTANVQGGEWTVANKMKSPRYGHTLTTMKGIIMATGGLSDLGSMSSVEFFSEEKGWKTASWSLSNADYGHCVIPLTNLNEIIYISGTGRNAVEVIKINIVDGSKVFLSSPPGATRGWNFCTHQSDIIYFVHHETGTKHRVWKYSISQDSWIELANVIDSEDQGLAFLGKELFFFGTTSIHVLRNGVWNNSVLQPKGEINYGPAIVILPGINFHI